MGRSSNISQGWHCSRCGRKTVHKALSNATSEAWWTKGYVRSRRCEVCRFHELQTIEVDARIHHSALQDQERLAGLKRAIQALPPPLKEFLLEQLAPDESTVRRAS